MLHFQESIDFIKSLYPNQDFIPLHEPKFIGNEKKYLMETIDSTFVSSVGKFVDQFEDMMKAFTGAKYAIAVVNGTSALHMALKLAGVQAGDLVLTQSLSFVATCNAISYLSADPFFVDVDHTLGMSPESLKKVFSTVELVEGKAIHKPSGKRIGAVVPMHTFGHPVRIDEIVELCSHWNVPVVEDAAESLGSTYKGQQTGTFGKLGTFSFNGNKTITCGGGGMIVTDDEELGKMAKHLTTQAKMPHKWEFRHDHIGYNYRCPNLNAALACAQLENLESFITNKRNTASQYQAFFEKTNNLQFVSEPNHAGSNYWLNAVLVNSPEERDLFLKETNENGVMTRPIWTLMHKLDMFSSCLRTELTESEKLEARIVNIPSSVR